MQKFTTATLSEAIPVLAVLQDRYPIYHYIPTFLAFTAGTYAGCSTMSNRVEKGREAGQ